MGAGHGHGTAVASTGHAGGRHRWRLSVAFGLVAVFFLVELVYGLISGSLALLSDAGHMAADVVALGAALLATRIAARDDSTGRRTYGSYRARCSRPGLQSYSCSAYRSMWSSRRWDGSETLSRCPPDPC